MEADVLPVGEIMDPVAQSGAYIRRSNEAANEQAQRGRDDFQRELDRARAAYDDQSSYAAYKWRRSGHASDALYDDYMRNQLRVERAEGGAQQDPQQGGNQQFDQPSGEAGGVSSCPINITSLFLHCTCADLGKVQGLLTSENTGRTAEYVPGADIMAVLRPGPRFEVGSRVEVKHPHIVAACKMKGRAEESSTARARLQRTNPSCRMQAAMTRCSRGLRRSSTFCLRIART